VIEGDTILAEQSLAGSRSATPFRDLRAHAMPADDTIVIGITIA